MIGKVTRGSDPAGLLRYLFGPGRHNEHIDPHIVAGWDADAGKLVQITAAGGFDLRRLTARLREPLVVAARNPDRSVWHCSLRTAPEDRRLTDDEWATTVRDVMARTGLDDGNGPGVRWVAIRHADDHVHIVATLARTDGTRVGPHNDYFRVAEACHATEHRYGLRPTPASDRTAGRQATRAEVEKATRAGLDEPARVTLRREVRAAAATTTTPDQFVDELRKRGVMVRLRYSQHTEGQVTGYAVAWPQDRAGSSPPAWFGGSKLASELSWNKLEQRWAACVNTSGSPDTGWAEMADELNRLDLRSDGAAEALGTAATAAIVRLNRQPLRSRAVHDDVARASRRAWSASRSVQHAHRRLLRTTAHLPAGERRDADVWRAALELVRLLEALAKQRKAQQQAAQAAAAYRAAHAIRASVGGPAPIPVASPLRRTRSPAAPARDATVSDRTAPAQLEALLTRQIVRPTLEVVHGMRPRRQLSGHVSTALAGALAHGLANRQRLAIASVGRLRVRVGSDLMVFSGSYSTVDGRRWPVAGEIRRRPSTGRPQLVALETALGRHTPTGPRPLTQQRTPNRPPAGKRRR